MSCVEGSSSLTWIGHEVCYIIIWLNVLWCEVDVVSVGCRTLPQAESTDYCVRCVECYSVTCSSELHGVVLCSVLLLHLQLFSAV
jgi:hypothetical protein